MKFLLSNTTNFFALIAAIGKLQVFVADYEEHVFVLWAPEDRERSRDNASQEPRCAKLITRFFQFLGVFVLLFVQ